MRVILWKSFCSDSDAKKKKNQWLGEQDKRVFALLEGDISWKGGIK